MTLPVSRPAAIATVLLAALATTPARADDATTLPGTVPPRARELAARGMALHAAGDYDGAIAAFTEAYALAPAPALVFDLAQAYRLGGRCEDAAVMYRRFLAMAPDADASALAQAAARRDGPLRRRGGPTPAVERRRCPTAPPRGRLGEARWPRARSVPACSGEGRGVLRHAGARRRRHDLDRVRARRHVERSCEGHRRGRPSRRDDLAVTTALTGAVAIATGAALYILGRNEQRALVVMPAPHGAEVHASWRF